MAVVKRCVMIKAVLPATSFRNLASQSASAQESMKLVGSSRMIKSACRKKARASASRCHSPPLNSAPPNHFPSHGVVRFGKAADRRVGARSPRRGFNLFPVGGVVNIAESEYY